MCYTPPVHAFPVVKKNRPPTLAATLLPSPMVTKTLRLLASLTAGTAVWAGTVTFDVKTDRPAIDYKTGEPITFTVRLLDDGQPAPGNKIAWLRKGDDRKTEQGEAASDTPLTITTTSEQPGFICLKLIAFDATGAALKNGGKAVAFAAGAAAEPARFETALEPADFDAFWARQKTRVAAVPLRELAFPSTPKFPASLSTT